MAAGNLYVVEYADVYKISGGNTDLPTIPINTSYILTTSSGASSIQSGLIQSNTRVIGLATDSANAVNVAFGPTGTVATSSGIHLPASSPQQLFALNQATSSFRVAAVFSAT